MASYSVEEFLGDGMLKHLIPKLLQGGWVDVPTLKTMNSEDMNAIKLTQRQKEALEIRSYLHDRSLTEYSDRLEASGKPLAELLTLNSLVLHSQFGMKRGHILHFTDTERACRNSMPILHVHSTRQNTMPSSVHGSSLRYGPSLHTRTMPSVRTSSKYAESIDQSLADSKIGEGYVFKGIVAAEPVGHTQCCCVRPPIMVDDVSPYSSIEKISVQKLTPEHKVGVAISSEMKSPPMRVSKLWRDKPVILLCLRRPGCVMCRAEAHQLYARKPIFDALGFQLIAVLHERIESEVKELWPHYWGGSVIFDSNKEFFKALGGGKLLKDKFVTGFLFNSRSISNYNRAKATGIESNSRGEGGIKGGLFIIGRGKSGIAYQFIERNFGDRAPISEIIQICIQIQSNMHGQEK